MEEAFAEYLGIDEDIFEMIGVIIDEDTGSSRDQVHYGYYAEFPTFKSLDSDIKEKLKEYDCFDRIPFGETEYVDDGTLGSTEADPFGWRADYEAEEYYEKYLLSGLYIADEIGLLKEKIEISNDDIIIKSLLFSAFSLTESYVRGFVWELIPDFMEINIDKRLKELIKKDLIKKLTKTHERAKLYKEFTGKKLVEIPYLEFRNVLAHDIGTGTLIEGKLTITDLNDKEHTEFVNIILDKLQEYVQSFDVSKTV